MTDKLRAAAEMALKAMQDIIHWYSERDENDEVLPPYNQTPEVLEAIQAVEALRQALTEPPKPNYVEVGQVVQAFGDMVVIEMPEMPPVGTKLYVATDDMTRKRD